MTPRVAIRNLSLFGVIFGIAVSMPAAQLKEAQVTQVVKDVKLLPTGGAARPAAVSDEVRDGIAVRTGVDSRSELKFTDQTLARLGANTLFSFSEGTRNLNLQDGAMLLRVPKGAGGAKISSSAVTAAITGTTVMVETHALTKKNKNSYYKFIVLEGTARLYLPGRLGESTLVKAGQMIIMRADSKMIPEPVDVDIGKITQSSLLVTGFSAPIGSEALIAFEKTKQNEQKNSGQLYETNLAILGAGTNVVLADPNTVDLAVTAESNAAQSPTPTPTPKPTPTPIPTPPASPTPSKFGTPIPITSLVPYLITSGTTISTDPAITTNGVTAYGKIYRGAETDGPLSAFIFGSTSSFDLATNFDANHVDSGGGFKFSALQLTGNPTISTVNGEINLGLISIGNITSAAPGGTLTFAGIRSLLLATQNGSITLGPEISFSSLQDITFYARGAGSALTFGSAISNVQHLEVDAEGSIQLNGAVTVQDIRSFAGVDFLAGSGSITATTSIDIHADNDVNFNLNQFPEGTNTGQFVTIDAGHNVNIDPTGDQTVFTNANIITVHAGNAINITGTSPTTLNLTSSTNTFGFIVAFSAGSDFTLTSSLTINLDNSGSGNLTAGANIILGATGNMIVNNNGSLDLNVLNNDGGQIGSGGDIALTAGKNLTANSINLFVNNRNGGNIGSGGNVSLFSGGTLTTTGDVTLGVSTRNDGNGGGIISSSSEVIFTAIGISIGGFFQTFVSTNGGGHIQGDVFDTVSASANLNAQQGILASIEDTGFGATGNFIAGGQIDGNAIVVLSAQNIITASTATGVPGIDTMALEASIYPNVGGKVGGDAIVNVFASQDISAPGTALFWVANGNYKNLGPGRIGGNAFVNVSGANISTGDLFHQILSYGGALIGGDASLSLNATNLSVNGTFDTRIDNTAATIHGNASMVFNTTTGLTSTGDQFYQLINADGGTIGGSATLDVTTQNLSSGRSLFVAILNSTNDGGATGTVASNATLNFNVSGTAAVATDATFQINGSDSAASSTINFNGGTYNVGGTFEGFMDGSGTMTFNNATIHADTVKAAIFGANGTLRIGGGSISANTLLHLYAPGSGGIIDFVSNVTLNSSATAAVIAANTVTIENGVVVTIGASTSANVYTNVPNYSARSGGNNKTSGTFVGAVTTQPLGGQPPFDSPSTRVARRSTRTSAAVIHVTDSSQLSSLLNNATPGPNGKVRVSPVTRSRNPSVQGSTRTMAAATALHRSADARVRSGVLASRIQ